ncbi:putative exosome complex exonuclease RRP41 [Gregarina niphandrodes]|uniref:Exosome complex exonuclease RRP41 n=1 Tax=Gregarina niphandrodes TaxID=110365 RepID=A0A023B5Y8_GRENI|nr:putative exosome complex exonuclease RRP41 [Gregarina niphandrodes]EZG64348.1 putative exosome complex exonuclease RRP41 [Gregarina niphandrodes]|eukprot:XP_011130637.1 putative exosome complex exonuclease RRP41 [Gregarina niphandrodes]
MASLDLLTAAGFRKDGRMLDQHRRVKAEMGSFGANGGATYQCGKTMVMAQVMEDEQVPCASPQLVVSLSWAPFAFPERRLQRQNRLSSTYEKALKDTFEPVLQNKTNPAAAINVQLTVLCADGGTLAACVNATTLALTRSGYALDDLVIASTVALADEYLFVDPTHYELIKKDCDLTVACLSRTKEVALMSSECKTKVDNLALMLETATESSIRDVLPVVVAAQEAHAQRVSILRTLVSERLIASV